MDMPPNSKDGLEQRFPWGAPVDYHNARFHDRACDDPSLFFEILVPRWITDFKPWTVEGKHYEDTGSGETIRTSSATGCHWDNTFNFY